MLSESDAVTLLKAITAAPRLPEVLLLPCNPLAKLRRAASAKRSERPATSNIDYKSSAYVTAHAALTKRLRQGKSKVRISTIAC